MERIIQVARIAGAHEFISEMPLGYDTYVEERGSSLSGGQKQRIAIARAFIMNPSILIFDEATSSINYESETLIQQQEPDSQGKNRYFYCSSTTVLLTAKFFVIDRGKNIETFITFL